MAISSEARLGLKMIIPGVLLAGSLFAIIDSLGHFIDMDKQEHTLEGLAGIFGIFGSAWVAQVIGHTHW